MKNHLRFTIILIFAAFCIQNLVAQESRPWFQDGPWRERTPEKYLELLDQAVEWCTDLGMYVLIDWHSIGNLEMELFQNPMYNTSKQETYQFWRTIAQHFSGNNTVAYHADMNFTMIRNWVGKTGDDEFYEACDRHGIMVWQDFWLANPVDGPDPYNPEMFMDNAKDLVKRIPGNV